MSISGKRHDRSLIQESVDRERHLKWMVKEKAEVSV
jgi:hypothetical protein